MLFPNGAVLGHVPSGLPHEPDGGAIDRLGPAGADKARIRSGHVSLNVAFPRLGRGTVAPHAHVSPALKNHLIFPINEERNPPADSNDAGDSSWWMHRRVACNGWTVIARRRTGTGVRSEFPAACARPAGAALPRQLPGHSSQRDPSGNQTCSAASSSELIKTKVSPPVDYWSPKKSPKRCSRECRQCSCRFHCLRPLPR